MLEHLRIKSVLQLAEDSRAVLVVSRHMSHKLCVHGLHFIATGTDCLHFLIRFSGKQSGMCPSSDATREAAV